MSHTKEPWEWSEHRFNAPPFEGTLEHECGIYPPLGESGPVAIASGTGNARRIVACVNACEGIPTETLEADGTEIACNYISIQQLEKAEQQRDELLKRRGADLREMLRAMQSGEMTVSRGIELVDMWLAGNYRDDMLPPVREGLGEDEMPWDRIDALTQQRDELLAAAEKALDVCRRDYDSTDAITILSAAIAKVKKGGV